MKVPLFARARQRLFGLVASGALFLAFSIGGCGPSSESSVEMTPDAKKAVMASKVGDPSKFVKPKGVGGKRR